MIKKEFLKDTMAAAIIALGIAVTASGCSKLNNAPLNVEMYVEENPSVTDILGESEEVITSHYETYGEDESLETEMDSMEEYIKSELEAAEIEAASLEKRESINVGNAESSGKNGWVTENGASYWYENGIRQGVKYSADGSIDTSYRGKEIYDPESDAWYWLDNIENGAKAVSKDVYQESLAGQWGDATNGAGEKIGKWVRYDAEGHMIKGWHTIEAGTYYFDLTYGTMAKGDAVIDGVSYHFDENTGILDNSPVKDDNGSALYVDGWHVINGVSYWYENGIRQGYDATNSSYRGKEIYDAGSNAWYWLDNVQQGAVAKNKDVYQESEAGAWGDVKGEDGKTYGKWVRYDENGHMVKGWQETEAGTYYFDPVYGTMAKGTVTMDGYDYSFDKATGVLIGKTEHVIVTEVKVVDGKPVVMNDGQPDTTYTGELKSADGKSYRFENGTAVTGLYWVESVPYVYDTDTCELVSVGADTDEDLLLNPVPLNDYTGFRLYDIYGDVGNYPSDKACILKTELDDGWHVVGGKTYYAKDGELLRFGQIIDGYAYSFDPDTGELYKGLEGQRVNAMTLCEIRKFERFNLYNGAVAVDKETGKLCNALVRIGHDFSSIDNPKRVYTDSYGNITSTPEAASRSKVNYYFYAFDAYGNEWNIWNFYRVYDASIPLSERERVPETLDFYQKNIRMPDAVLYAPTTGQLVPALSEGYFLEGTVLTGLKVRYELIYDYSDKYEDGFYDRGDGNYTAVGNYNIIYEGEYSEEFLQYLKDNGLEAPDKDSFTCSEKQCEDVIKRYK